MPLKRVAARLGDHRHLRAAGLDLAEVARDGERDFLRVLHVGDVAGHARAAARRAGVDAVERQAAVLRVAAVRREEQHAGAQLGLAVASHHAGRELQHVVVRARRRQRLEDVAVDHLLAPRAAGVDDRRLTGDRHRLLERADAKLGVDASR